VEPREHRTTGSGGGAGRRMRWGNPRRAAAAETMEERTGIGRAGRWPAIVLMVMGCCGTPVRPQAAAGRVLGSESAVCLPTGWVDRIEGAYAVVVTDADEEEVVPTFCFPEPVRAGTRVILGRVDWDETRKVRTELDALQQRLRRQ